MLRVIMIVMLLTTLSVSGWVSKQQYFNILNFHMDLYEVVAMDDDFERFKDYLYGMYLRESSLGLNQYSDREETKYYYIHQNKKVFVDKSVYDKAHKYDDGSGRYTYVEYWGNEYAKRLYVIEGEFKPVTEASLGDLKIRVPTAKFIINYWGIEEYEKYLYDDSLLVNALLNDRKFSLHLTLLYMKFNYQTAVKRGYSKPVLRAISRHNGGWNNWTYVNKVKADVDYVFNAIEENRWNVNREDYIRTRYGKKEVSIVDKLE